MSFMTYNFDTFPDRRKTDSEKWRAYPEDVLPMWVADMDFVSPEAVIAALHKRVEHGIFGYGCHHIPELDQAVIDWLASRYHWQINPEDLAYIPGVVTGFNLACHAFTAPGEAVLIQTPVYPPFFYAPANARLVKQEMELTRNPDGRYEIDFDAFEAAIDDQTRLFILCNPHNPVGRVFSRAELERMAEICLRRNILICSDEIHADLVYPQYQHIPIASLSPEIAGNTITLIAPSKTFNIAGLHCSIAIIQNAELRKRYNQARQGLVGGVDVLGLTAALAAYRHGRAWLDALMAYLQGNRDYLCETVQTEMPGLSVYKPEGSYLAWIDCRQAGIQGNPYQFFLDRARVAVNDGASFGKGGEGFIRLNFGCPRSMLAEALERMKNSLQGVESKVTDQGIIQEQTTS